MSAQQAVGGGVGGLELIGSILGAKGELDNGEAVAKAALYNARLVRYEADIEEERIRRGARRFLADKQANAVGKGNVCADGTVLEALQRDASEFERDALNVRRAARNTGRLERMRADAARSTARYRATSSILGGVAGAGATAYKYGVFSSNKPSGTR